ncbi:ATP-binding cassette domain-containing protein [Clostridium sp. MCC353]|uniref:ABC transporter ATP-binding protein n=1 Tax=Clostridium sp. MCC353 TaxID=2592646 RepID=UPI001C0170E7|nr:ABC transporter ATP-binding protein [Clostridium sp. MCC353]MBT9777023.1 ATP-binding cassette domain-containing protein [Clostridium sp. MCC353]
MSVRIDIENVVKQYDNGKITIIPDLTVHIKNGEFFTLLGPSGCGKTTLLRMIAGFNSVEGGKIKFDGQVINNIPANKRNIGMVFQDYAIFPHMTVKENVAYGLKLRRLSKREIAEKADEIMKTVKIDQYQDRLPEKLSGGQRQRVALARAIVIRPNVLLMDEPLSNLDAKLRVDMRTVIKEIQQEVGITTVYVTHDQEEALAISDRIAVMNGGVIQQMGRPRDIYSRPANVFVSTFIGHSNLLGGKLHVENGTCSVVFANGFEVRMNNLVDSVTDGMEVIVAVRPEEFSVAQGGLEAEIHKATFLGQNMNYQVRFADHVSWNPELVNEFVQDMGTAHTFYHEGDKICLIPNAAKINVFTKDGTASLMKDVMKNE